MQERAKQPGIKDFLGFSDVKVILSTRKGLLLVQQLEIDHNSSPTGEHYTYEYSSIQKAAKGFENLAIKCGESGNFFLSMSLIAIVSGNISENPLYYVLAFASARVALDCINISEHHIKTLRVLNEHLNFH